MDKKCFTPDQLAKNVKLNGRNVSAKTVIRRCESGQLPSDMEPVKVGRSWIILVGF